MKASAKLLIVGALAVAVVATVALKQNTRRTKLDSGASVSAATVPATTNSAPSAPTLAASPSGVAAKLPKLLDLGADKCIPCRMMAPILEQLKKEYAGRLEVEFIDVWKNPEAGKRHGIQMIPTQIFYDTEGRERARHVGFISKEDILAKFRELGVNLDGGTPLDKPVN